MIFPTKAGVIATGTVSKEPELKYVARTARRFFEGEISGRRHLGITCRKMERLSDKR